VSNDSNPGGIEGGFRLPRIAVEEPIEKHMYVRHAVRNPGVDSSSSLRGGLNRPRRQLLRDHLRVIQRRDHVPVTAQVGAQKRGRPSVPALGCENTAGDGVRAGPRHRAHGGLNPRCVEGGNPEEVLGFRGLILARVVRAAGYQISQGNTRSLAVSET
jgi:hypothetical protein